MALVSDGGLIPCYPFRPPAPGTTFSVPIYTVQDDGRNVFAGVLGLDYTFDDIAEFLKVNFMKSTTIVAIF